MNLEGSDEKIRLANWLADAERAGAMGTMIDSQHCVSVRPAEHSATVTQIESSKLLPFILIVAFLAGGSLIASLWAMDRASSATQSANDAREDMREELREVRAMAQVATFRTEGFTRALIAKGIDPYPHLKGEDP
jgi:hypothetical protein